MWTSVCLTWLIPVLCFSGASLLLTLHRVILTVYILSHHITFNLLNVCTLDVRSSWVWLIRKIISNVTYEHICTGSHQHIQNFTTSRHASSGPKAPLRYPYPSLSVSHIPTGFTNPHSAICCLDHSELTSWYRQHAEELMSVPSPTCLCSTRICSSRRLAFWVVRRGGWDRITLLP